MLWSEIKKVVDERLRVEGIDDTTFSSVSIYESAEYLDIYFNQDGELVIQGEKHSKGNK